MSTVGATNRVLPIMTLNAANDNDIAVNAILQWGWVLWRMTHN